MTESTKNPIETLLGYGAIALVSYGVMSTDFARNFFAANIRIVARETNYIPNPNYSLGSGLPVGEYQHEVTLQNTGRAGHAYFYVVQNEDQIVCRDQFFLNSGERRSFTLECPNARDGTFQFIAANHKRH